MAELAAAQFFSANIVPNFDAAFSPCKRFRYALVRRWNATRPMGLILGINPSVAGKLREDQTTRKLEGFTTRWGWGGYWLLNPFAFAATDQRALLLESDPVGPDNDAWLEAALAHPLTGPVVVAWGRARTAGVRRLLTQRLVDLHPILGHRHLMCLGTTQDGSPQHPLMLGYSTPLVPWAGEISWKEMRSHA